MKITFITNGGTGGVVDTNTWRTITAGGNTLTGAPSGETLAFTEGTGISITESAGAVTITNDNPTDTNTNIANTNLTTDADRQLTIGTDDLVFMGTKTLISWLGGNSIIIGEPTTSTSYNLPLTRPAINQVMKATDASGTIGWGDSTNISNASLTADAAYKFNLNEFTSAFVNVSSEELLSFPAGAGVTIGFEANSYNMPLTRPASDQVLSAVDGSGTIGWVTPAGDTNTNVANSNLTMSGGSKTTDVGANTLTFDSGTTNILKIDGANDVIKIGAASPYTMPTTRASAASKVLISTDALGGTSFNTITADGGAMCMFQSGSAGSWASSSYGWFKKNGGGMHIDVDLNISGGGALSLESFIWNARLIPSSWKFVGKRDAGSAAGLNAFVAFDTPNTGATNISWNVETNFATGLLAANTANWQVHSGVFAEDTFENVADGDFWTFAFVAEDALANVDSFLTIYFSSAIS